MSILEMTMLSSRIEQNGDFAFVEELFHYNMAVIFDQATFIKGKYLIYKINSML